MPMLRFTAMMMPKWIGSTPAAWTTGSSSGVRIMIAAGGLGGREDAAIDAAEDDDRRAERPAGVLGGLPDLRPGCLLADQGDIAGARIEHDVDAVDEPDEQARQDAGREQVDGRLLRR